jgi:hypothetical protein
MPPPKGPDLNSILRIIIGLAALIVASMHLWTATLKFDFTKIDFEFFSLTVFGLVFLFARRARLKAADIGGFRLEFDEPEPDLAAIRPSETYQREQPSDSVNASTSSNLGDDYFVRLAKLTPVESLLIYLILMGLSEGEKYYRGNLIWTPFVITFLLTPFYAFMVSKVGWVQAVFLTISFVAWAFAIGGPFATLTWYQPVYGALALGAASLVAPLAYVSVRPGLPRP